MTRPILMAPTLIVLAGVVGCGPSAEPGPPSGLSVSDSSGVRIVTSSASAPADTVRPVLLWEHGAAPGDYPFSAIGFGVVRDDSVAVVVEPQNREVVGIAPGGGEHMVLARRGQGPSEVVGPHRIVAGPGNEVWLEDIMNLKLMRFVGDSLAEVLGASAIPWVPASLTPVGVDAEGRLLVTTNSYDENFDEAWLRGTNAVFDASTSSVDTVGSYDYVPRAEGQPISPFGLGGVVSVAGGEFVTARNDLPRVLWRSSDGTALQVFEWDEVVRFPDDEDWEALRAEIRRQVARSSQAARDVDAIVDDVLTGYSLDTTRPLPLFSHILGSETGNVWIAPFTPQQVLTAGGWRVAGRAGGWLGAVEFPRPVRVLHVSEDLVLGIHTDALDVPTIAVYENPFGR